MTLPPSQLRLALVVLCIAGMTACSKPVPAPVQAKAAVPATSVSTGADAAPTNAPVHLVVFDPLGGAGRDPFFPSSTRMPVPAETNGNPIAIVRPLLPLSSYLKLTGLWSGPRNPMAFINKTDFRPGDQGMVTIMITNAQEKLESRQVLVRCLEIRRESVVISVEGESGPKELHLPAMP